jgi:hypothetical protein
MLQLFSLSALRRKSKSHPHLSFLTNKTVSQGATAVVDASHEVADEKAQYINNANMGKSNKFDCTNRRNEGIDLGKSIGDAALKELGKTKKDAARQAGRARKVSTGSLTGGDNEVNGVHFIDLIAPSKALTDDGVAAMVEGLHAAMKAGDSNASVTLEGLNLRHNGLTTRALATLAPVIDLAQNELKTIVLSENNITVTSDAEARD